MEKQITLTLSVQELQAVVAGLGKLPIEVGLAAFNAVVQQSNAQMQPAAEPLKGKAK